MTNTESNNLEYYNKLKTVPKWALKEIKAGRLRGMTDIKPQWRIQVMTETFGPAGIGWKYVVDRKWLEDGSDGQKAGFVDVSLYIKHNGEWSDAIPGTGGASFIANERNGAYTSDEVFKMALTDALSVAMKALGVAGDIYAGGDRTKYTKDNETKSEVQTENEKKIEKRKLELVEEIKTRILEDVKNDMIAAQERLSEVTKGKAKTTNTLKKWTFAQVKIVHNKVCTPEM